MREKLVALIQKYAHEKSGKLDIPAPEVLFRELAKNGFSWDKILNTLMLVTDDELLRQAKEAAKRSSRKDLHEHRQPKVKNSVLVQQLRAENTWLMEALFTAKAAIAQTQDEPPPLIPAPQPSSQSSILQNLGEKLYQDTVLVRKAQSSKFYGRSKQGDQRLMVVEEMSGSTVVLGGEDNPAGTQSNQDIISEEGEINITQERRSDNASQINRNVKGKGNIRISQKQI